MPCHARCHSSGEQYEAGGGTQAAAEKEKAAWEGGGRKKAWFGRGWGGEKGSLGVKHGMGGNTMLQLKGGGSLGMGRRERGDINAAPPRLPPSVTIPVAPPKVQACSSYTIQVGTRMGISVSHLQYSS